MNALKPGIDLLRISAMIISVIDAHPVCATIRSITAGFTALLSIVALAVAGFARANASIYAMITGFDRFVSSMGAATGGSTRLGLAIRDLSASLIGLYPWLGRATNGMFGLASASNTAAGSAAAATTATTGLRAAIVGLGRLTGIGAIIMGVGWAVGKLIDNFTQARSASNSFMSDTQGLANAIRLDTIEVEEGADAYMEFRREVADTFKCLATCAQELSGAVGAQRS